MTKLKPHPAGYGSEPEGQFYTDIAALQADRDALRAVLMEVEAAVLTRSFFAALQAAQAVCAVLEDNSRDK